MAHLAHARAQNGYTALMYAADNGHTDCVRLLLNSGADKSAKNKVCIVGPPRLQFGACLDGWRRVNDVCENIQSASS